MITPKTINHIMIGTTKFPARTENQIKEAINNVIKMKPTNSLDTIVLLKEELGL